MVGDIIIARALEHLISHVKSKGANCDVVIKSSESPKPVFRLRQFIPTHFYRRAASAIFHVVLSACHDISLSHSLSSKHAKSNVLIKYLELVIDKRSLLIYHRSCRDADCGL
jgi:hypothetical protein